MSISTGLYPKLDLWKANKLHYISLSDFHTFLKSVHLHKSDEETSLFEHNSTTFNIFFTNFQLTYSLTSYFREF